MRRPGLLDLSEPREPMLEKRRLPGLLSLEGGSATIILVFFMAREDWFRSLGFQYVTFLFCLSGTLCFSADAWREPSPDDGRSIRSGVDCWETDL